MGAEFVERDWELVKRQLPAGWKEAARETGAIKLERGALADPEVLLRVLLGRAASDKPHRDVVEHVKQTGLVEVSNVALHKRERKCGAWLQWIADAMLDNTMSELPEQRLRLRLIDATCASRPGSKGTDFRLHVCVELPERRFCQAELTDKQGGETFERFQASPGDVVVGDRGYATAKGIAHVLLQGAYSLVRVNASSLPLFGTDGCRIDPLALARSLAPGEMMEVPVVPQHMMSTAQVFAVYRVRWQVELAFKTLKTVLHYARLPNRRPDSGRTWLLAKLVCALILERIAAASAARPPESAAA